MAQEKQLGVMWTGEHFLDAGFRPWYNNWQGQKQNLKANVPEMIQMNNESGAVEK